MSLTPKQSRFITEYLVDRNATRAAVRAGYAPKSAKGIAHGLLKKPEVRDAVRAATRAQEERTQISADRVLQELARIAFFDPAGMYDGAGRLLHLREMPEDARRVVSSVEQDALYDDTGENRTQVGLTTKVKLWEKTKALEQIGRHLGMFKDRVGHELDGPGWAELVQASLQKPPKGGGGK